MAEAGNCAVDQRRIDLLQILIPETKALHDTRTIVFHQDVAFLNKIPENLLSFFRLQVQGDSPLISVQVHEVGALSALNDRCIVTGIVSAARHLDLNNIRAHVSEHHAAVGTCQNSCHIQNFYAFQ